MESSPWIVDSIWITPDPATPDSDCDDLETLAAESTEREQICLEHESEYERVGFVPQRESATRAR